MYAQETEYFDDIQRIRENFTEEDRLKDAQSHERLIRLARKESDCVGDDRKNRK